VFETGAGVLDSPTANDAAMTGVTTGFEKLLLGSGGKDEGVDDGWDGGIDDIRIYGRALSNAEIAGPGGKDAAVRSGILIAVNKTPARPPADRDTQRNPFGMYWKTWDKKDNWFRPWILMAYLRVPHGASFSLRGCPGRLGSECLDLFARPFMMAQRYFDLRMASAS